jgi:hypothetical protein
LKEEVLTVNELNNGLDNMVEMLVKQRRSGLPDTWEK